MRGRVTTDRTRKTARREAEVKAPRMGKGTPPREKDPRLAQVLEEWLAEARIRYTHAGE